MFRKLRKIPAIRLTVHRLLQSIPVLFGVTFGTFCLLNLLPGTAALALLGTNATPEAVKELNIRLHLNEPFFTRYWNWLSGALTGHLGTSLVNGDAVTSILAQRLPVSLELVIFAFVLAILVAVPMSVLAARRRGGVADRVNIVVSMFGLSVPNFVVGLFLILIFSVHLKLFPAFGFTPLSKGLLPNLRSMLLPAITLALGLLAAYNRVLRADLVDQMEGEDYVVTAKAKGIPPRQVLLRHALRNSLFGLITLVALNLGTLIGGTVVVEQIFALPGIGQELLLAIGVKDVPMVQAIVAVVAVAVVVGGLLADILYAALDPRIRHGSRAA